MVNSGLLSQLVKTGLPTVQLQPQRHRLEVGHGGGPAASGVERVLQCRERRERGGEVAAAAAAAAAVGHVEEVGRGVEEAVLSPLARALALPRVSPLFCMLASWSMGGEWRVVVSTTSVANNQDSGVACLNDPA